jgi:hypothetical protein
VNPTLERTTHEKDREDQLRYWKSLTPQQRVELAVEMSRRMRQLEADNGRAPEAVSSFVKRRRG